MSSRLVDMSRKTVEYYAWSSMWTRCTNPKYELYHRYGGRGITVCDRWKSFDNFLEDMGKRPLGKHSLGRIENDGNYEKSNCRWETRKEQSSNTQRNIKLELNGRTETVLEWSRILGVKCAVLYWRFHQGWSAERILTQPIK